MPTKSRFDIKNQINPIILYPINEGDWEVIQELRLSIYIHTIDQIDSQVIDLIKADNPEIQLTIEELNCRLAVFFKDKARDFYGTWVFYPWKNTLVHILNE
jgi:hypothetical protein